MKNTRDSGLRICGWQGLSRIIFLCVMVLAGDASAEVLRVTRIALTVSDLERSESFYRDALGFERVIVTRIEDPAFQHLLGVKSAWIDSLIMRLGNEEVEFLRYENAGKPYPAESRSPDLWFQHFAIIVSDMSRAYAHLKANARFDPISEDGPQTLPPQNGHVQAFKFRDPDGHPLELLYFPPGTGRPVWNAGAIDSLFLGIDHSAIGVGDTPRSKDFYENVLGLQERYRIVNRGPTQERLDGTFNAVVEITGLFPHDRNSIGVEFLDYLAPPTGRSAPIDAASNDIAHAHLIMVVDDLAAMERELSGRRIPLISPGTVTLDDARHGFRKAVLLRDPDGHALMLTQ